MFPIGLSLLTEKEAGGEAPMKSQDINLTLSGVGLTCAGSFTNAKMLLVWFVVPL